MDVTETTIRQEIEAVGTLTSTHGLNHYKLKNGFPNPTMLADGYSITPPYSDDLPTLETYLKLVAKDWFGVDGLEVMVVVSLPEQRST